MTLAPKAILFDLYGTLVDVHGIAAAADMHFPGKGKALSALWRDKQLAYSWLRTLGNNYVDFAVVTAEALDYAAEALDLPLTAAGRRDLLDAYRHLPAFADVPPALAALKATGVPLAVLSNGTPDMLEATMAAAGIRDAFAAVLSVDAVRRFKTASEAYTLGPERFGANAAEMVFVSSNGWDAAGATWFGYRAFWINRLGLPVERLGVTPAGMGSSLGELAAFIAT